MAKEKKKDKMEEPKKPKVKKAKVKAPEVAAVTEGTAVVAPPIKEATKKPKSPAKKAAKKVAVVVTVEEISLRAYFISEHRRHHGLPGDEASDWTEAERQLTAEAKKK